MNSTARARRSDSAAQYATLRITWRDLNSDGRQQAIELRLDDRGIERELQREVGAVRDRMHEATVIAERTIVLHAGQERPRRHATISCAFGISSSMA